jgi:hypothetical protein
LHAARRCRRTEARKHRDEAVTGLSWEATYLSRLGQQ